MTPSLSAPDAPPPPRPAFRLGALIRLRPSGRRWPIALRAALSTGAPVAVGWAVGDIQVGLIATLGAFTALYAPDRPYRNRAVILAGVALSLALVVILGVATQRFPLLEVPAVVLIAMAATFLCDALKLGPPGAYMFALACAAGTAIPTQLAVWQVGALVLGGGAVSWLLHMAGALRSPREPERRAVATAANAVARVADATGTTTQDSARHAAAVALHDAWAALVTFQPARPRPDGALTHLRALARELHLLFVACIDAVDRPATDLRAVAERARAIGASAVSPGEDTERTDPAHVPLGHLKLADALRENLRPWSPALMATLRVGIAVAIAGALAAAILDRGFWAMAAAVLMLHQGLDWTQTLQRGMERMAGTLVGLGLAGLILAVHPDGLWLAATLMALQFVIEMLVTRNYALAVVFITAIALTIASAGHQVLEPGHLLWVRGADTLIGCAVGLVVHVLTARWAPAMPIRHEIGRTLAQIRTVVQYLATGDVTTVAATRARRDLQRAIIQLVTSCEREMGGLPLHRDAAERMWPAVVATQRLAYRVLAACWSLEDAGAPRARAMASALLPAAALAGLSDALTKLADAARMGVRPLPLAQLPDFLAAEVQNLNASLVSEAG